MDTGEFWPPICVHSRVISFTTTYGTSALGSCDLWQDASSLRACFPSVFVWKMCCLALTKRCCSTLSEKVVAFKSICAYRSGLRINPLVSAQAAENGLQENLRMRTLLCFIFSTHMAVCSHQYLYRKWSTSVLQKVRQDHVCLQGLYGIMFRQPRSRPTSSSFKQRIHWFHVCSCSWGCHAAQHPYADSYWVRHSSSTWDVGFLPLHTHAHQI